MDRNRRANLTRVTLGWMLIPAISGCFVPQAKHDRLLENYELEQKSHTETQRELAQTQQDLEAVQSQLDELRKRLESNQSALDENASKLAEVEHERSVTQQEHQQATDQVNQLREELARLASHLASFAEAREQLSEERDQLSRRLSEITERMSTLESQGAQVRERQLLVRDLTLALHKPLNEKKLRLGVTTDSIALSITRAEIWSSAGKMSPAGERLLDQLGKTLSPLRERLELELIPPDANAKTNAQRLSSVADRLRRAGVAQNRISWREASPAAPTSATAAKEEQLLRIWVRSAARSDAATASRPPETAQGT